MKFYIFYTFCEESWKAGEPGGVGTPLTNVHRTFALSVVARSKFTFIE